MLASTRFQNTLHTQFTCVPRIPARWAIATCHGSAPGGGVMLIRACTLLGTPCLRRMLMGILRPERGLLFCSRCMQQSVDSCPIWCHWSGSFASARVCMNVIVSMYAVSIHGCVHMHMRHWDIAGNSYSCYCSPLSARQRGAWGACRPFPPLRSAGACSVSIYRAPNSACIYTKEYLFAVGGAHSFCAGPAHCGDTR